MARLKLAIVLLVASVAACDPPPAVMNLTGSNSPDGKWTADAITTQDSGAGQFAFHTAVYLKSRTDPKMQAPVLVFPNAITKEKGKIEISFLWSDETLQVLLSRIPKFDTQATRYAGMNITVSQYFDKPTLPSAKQLNDIFHSSDPKGAHRLLADLHCTPKTPEQVTAVREAWHELGSTTSTEVTQDHYVQSVMALCLIQGQPQNAAPDSDVDSAVALSRVSVRSSNIIEALVAAHGLIHHADPRDNQSVVDVVMREPKMTTAVSTELIYNCSPNAARMLQMIREQAKDPEVKGRLERAVKLAGSQPSEKCDAPH